MYIDLTGLGCYHKQDVPKWYDKLEESERWNVQARFWQAVAKVCKDSPAIFCYNLMNEPVLPSKNSGEWLKGELSGKYFVQRIALDLKGRSRKEIAKAWVAQLSSAIREGPQAHDYGRGDPMGPYLKEPSRFFTIPRWASPSTSSACTSTQEKAKSMLPSTH